MQAISFILKKNLMGKNYLFLNFFSVAIFCLFSACSQSSIVGKWESADHLEVYEFKTDNTLLIDAFFDGNYELNWSIKGDKLHLSGGEETEAIDILHSSKDSLVLGIKHESDYQIFTPLTEHNLPPFDSIQIAKMISPAVFVQYYQMEDGTLSDSIGYLEFYDDYTVLASSGELIDRSIAYEHFFWDIIPFYNRYFIQIGNATWIYYVMEVTALSEQGIQALDRFEYNAQPIVLQKQNVPNPSTIDWKALVGKWELVSINDDISQHPLSKSLNSTEYTSIELSENGLHTLQNKEKEIYGEWFLGYSDNIVVFKHVFETKNICKVLYIDSTTLILNNKYPLANPLSRQLKYQKVSRTGMLKI